MKAMIFAAGLGARLRPLTDTCPKALVRVNGTPLLELVIRRLTAFGVDEIIVNVHHLADQIIAFLHHKRNFGITVQVSHEAGQLLDTGGGLKRAAWFFDDAQPFLAHNVDILTNLDLRRLYEAHCQSAALATLAVQHRPSSRVLLFNGHKRLHGWKDQRTNEAKIARPAPETVLTPLAFSGIQVLSPAIFALMPDMEVFSIIELYLALAAEHPILAFEHDQSWWLDVGKPEQLRRAAEFMTSGQQSAQRVFSACAARRW